MKPKPLPEILWPAPNLPVPRLGKTDVHLWTACLDEFSQFISVVEPALFPDEKSRASRFKLERHRDRFVIQSGLLRYLLSQYLEVAPSEHSFKRGGHGKPELVTAPGGEPLYFNVSHSDSMVLYAITQATAIGVDIERVRTIDDLDEIARRFFTPGETAALRALGFEERLVGFFNCWTRKEAVLKATGEGITGGLDIVEVTLKPGGPAQVLNTRGGAEDINHWSLHPLAPVTGYVATLAHQGPPLELKCWAVPLAILKRRL